MIMGEGVTRIAATYKAELRLGPSRAQPGPRPGGARVDAGPRPGQGREEAGRRPGQGRKEAGRRPGRGRAEAGRKPANANRPDAMRARPVRLTRVESRS